MDINRTNFYAVQRPVGKITDIPEMRDEFIKIFDTKTKHELARFGLALGEHLIDAAGFEATDEIKNAFAAVREWTGGNVNYHKARTSAGFIHDLARNEPDSIEAKFYRTMAQIACIPHVKYHALWASDFAVALVNNIYPGDLDAVRKERKIQVELLGNIL